MRKRYREEEVVKRRTEKGRVEERGIEKGREIQTHTDKEKKGEKDRRTEIGNRVREEKERQTHGDGE